MNFLQSAYLAYFSSPVENRKVYQAVCRSKPTTILEFGIQRGIRSVHLLELAKRFHPAGSIQYCCVDPFEGRTVEDGPGLSLRKAYKMLSKTEIRIQTIPDTPVESLRHVTGSIRQVGLLVVATPSTDWIFEHRSTLLELLHEKAIVFFGASTPDGNPFELRSCTVSDFRNLAPDAFIRPLRRAA